MSKLKKVLWFSPMGGGMIGIALTENEAGEKKAYIKKVAGVNEEQDELDIMQHGAKVTESMAEELFEHLKQ